MLDRQSWHRRFLPGTCTISSSQTKEGHAIIASHTRAAWLVTAVELYVSATATQARAHTLTPDGKQIRTPSQVNCDARRFFICSEEPYSKIPIRVTSSTVLTHLDIYPAHQQTCVHLMWKCSQPFVNGWDNSQYVSASDIQKFVDRHDKLIWAIYWKRKVNFDVYVRNICRTCSFNHPF